MFSIVRIALIPRMSKLVATEVHQGEFYSSLFNGFYNASKNSESDIVFVNLAKHSDDPVQHIINLSKKYSGICLFLPNLEKIDYKRIRQGVGVVTQKFTTMQTLLVVIPDLL